MRSLIEKIELRSSEASLSESYDVGFTWDAVGGKRMITKKLPDGRFLVTSPGGDPNGMGQYIFNADDVDFDVRNDTAKLAQMKKDSEADARDASRKKEAEDTNGFADQFSPMMRKKVINALLKTMLFNGVIKTRKKAIEDKVSSGAIVEKSKKYSRILIDDKGAFLREADLTKIGIDYAEYLIKTRYRNKGGNK